MPHTPKMIVSIWGNIWHLSEGKKSTSSFTFSLSWFLLQKYCELVLVTWLLLDAWLCTPKVILSIYRKRSCLSAAKKSTSSSMIFWKLTVSVLAHNSRTSIFSNMGLVVKLFWTRFGPTGSKVHFCEKEGCASF